MIPGVTGATGFVGMVHIAALCRAGIRPRILVRGGHPWATNAPDEVEVVVGDLHDKAALKDFGRGLTHVFIMRHELHSPHQSNSCRRLTWRGRAIFSRLSSPRPGL